MEPNLLSLPLYSCFAAASAAALGSPPPVDPDREDRPLPDALTALELRDTGLLDTPEPLAA